MKKCITLLLCLLTLCTSFCSALSETVQSPFLDAAFSLLEKDNVFLRRYNELTGADVQPLFEYGVPYLFGGKGDKLFLSKYPMYAKRKCLETTRFYRKGSVYIYGLDCSGFTQWVYAQCGMPRHDTLSNMILQYKYERNGNHLFNHRPGHEMPPYDRLKDTLRAGDLLVAKKARGTS